jgi:hypothetical protein
MNILLRNDNNLSYKLLISSTVEESFNSLMQYLERYDIVYTDEVPQKRGFFCIPEKDKEGRYDVYQSVFNKEDNIYESYYVYSLIWLFYDKPI